MPRPRGQLWQRLESMLEGQWIDAGYQDTRSASKTVRNVAWRVEQETGMKFSVVRNKRTGTIWVGCTKGAT